MGHHLPFKLWVRSLSVLLVSAVSGQVALGGSSSLNPSHVMTLDEAYESAVAKTEVVPIGESRLEQADARVGQSIGRFLPTISAGASYARQDSIGPSSESKSTRISVSQPLFQGGRYAFGLAAAQADRQASLLDVDARRVSVYSLVARRFFQVQSTLKEVSNLGESISLMKNRIDELSKRTAIGRSRPGEVLTAQAQLSLLQAQLEAARGDLTIARDRFSDATGIPRETALAEPDQLPKALESLESYLDRRESRPDVRSLAASVRSAEQNVRVAWSGHLPTASFTGNYYPSRTGTLKDVSWDLGVGLTIPLFEGGIVRGRVREATARENEIELLLVQQRRTADTEIRAAYHSVQAAMDQVKTLEDALKITERNYHEQVRDYRFSLVTNLDVLQALNSFQDTRRAFDRARYLAFAAWADLKAAVAMVPGLKAQPAQDRLSRARPTEVHPTATHPAETHQ